MPTLGSLFDGIGGFPLAAIHNGITPVWASEIEPFPIEVTQLRFPDMLHVGDITKLNGADLPPVDIITGGSPCQDLSVAGARAGLAGARSGLFMEQVRIVKEMRDADERRGRTAHAVRPRYMCWENVPGAFSSSEGEDFRIVLEEIVRIKDSTCSVPGPDSGTWESVGAIILGDQFSLAWRVLDAQYWGVAQRRKRIFLVADFAGRSAPKILFEQNSLLGNPAPSGSSRKRAATSAQTGSDDSGWADTVGFDGYNGDLTGDKAATLGVNCGMSTGRNGVISGWTAFAANQRDEVRDLHDVAAALGAQPGMKQQTFVAGVIAKGNGDCFLSSERHTSLSGGGGQAGQGYPCILTAGFSAGAGATAGSIGYGEEIAPTLKGAASGNCMPSILCLNDQGGQRMDLTHNKTSTLRAQMGSHQPIICLNDQGGSAMAYSEDVSGTLRAQEHGHQPLVFDNHGQDTRFLGPVNAAQTVSATFGMGGNNQPLVVAEQAEESPTLFENHGIDARYTGPHKVAPTMSARYGTGGNNVPLVAQRDDTFCITGNAIDRQPMNGGNGIGYQQGIAYTLTATDHHAVFSRQRVDVFKDDDVASTQSARQHKDATDLVMDLDESENKVSAETSNLVRLIRRLTPLECERLQGFPDGWTEIKGASDSARYKALGNSVAIPCVDFVLQGIAWAIAVQAT